MKLFVLVVVGDHLLHCVDILLVLITVLIDLLVLVVVVDLLLHGVDLLLDNVLFLFVVLMDLLILVVVGTLIVHGFGPLLIFLLFLSYFAFLFPSCFSSFFTCLLLVSSSVGLGS